MLGCSGSNRDVSCLCSLRVSPPAKHVPLHRSDGPSGGIVTGTPCQQPRLKFEFLSSPSYRSHCCVVSCSFSLSASLRRVPAWDSSFPTTNHVYHDTPHKTSRLADFKGLFVHRAHLATSHNWREMTLEILPAFVSRRHGSSLLTATATNSPRLQTPNPTRTE
jgi:hypothetical protein